VTAEEATTLARKLQSFSRLQTLAVVDALERLRELADSTLLDDGLRQVGLLNE
jgi:hypothetical protein